METFSAWSQDPPAPDENTSTSSADGDDAYSTNSSANPMEASLTEPGGAEDAYVFDELRRSLGPSTNTNSDTGSDSENANSNERLTMDMGSILGRRTLGQYLSEDTTGAETGDDADDDDELDDDDEEDGELVTSGKSLGGLGQGMGDGNMLFTGDQCWKQVKVNQYDGEIPSQRSLHTAVAYQQSMYIFGGYTGRERVNKLHRFDFLSSTWHALDDATGELPVARDRHTGVVVEDYMLIFGGYDGMLRCHDTHAYDFRNNRWLPIELDTALMPSPRHSHAACSFGKKMYVTCGYDGSYRNDLYEFRVKNLVERGVNDGESPDDTRPRLHGEWRKILAKGRFPQARYRATCCVHASQQSSPKIVLFGGHNGLVHLNCTHIFDIGTETWSSLRTTGSVPLPRDSHCAVMYGDNMLVFGGSCGQPLNDFSFLNMTTYEWKPVSGDSWTPSARFCASAVLHDGSFYLFGGYDSTERLRDIHRFNFAASLCAVGRSTLIDDFGASFKQDYLSDMVFEADGLVIPAHRVFCTRCSNILQDLESGPDSNGSEPEKEGRRLISTLQAQGAVRNQYKKDAKGRWIVELPKNLSLANIDAFLGYLYTDKIPLSSQTMALEIFALADHYAVKRLKKICLNYISTHLRVDTAAHIFQAADLHKMRELRERTLNFILRNFDAVSKTDAFEEMGRINVELVFEVLRNRGDEVHNATPEESPTGVAGSMDNLMSDNVSFTASMTTPPGSMTGISSETGASIAPYTERARQWVPVGIEDDTNSPGKRSLHAMAVHKDTILLFGGYNGRARVNDFFQFPLRTRRWEIVPVAPSSGPPPSARDRHAIMQLDDRLWVFGGYNGQSRVNELHAFNLRSHEWLEIPESSTTPSPRHSHSGCSVPSRHCFYIFGGYDGSYLNDLYEFDGNKLQWRLMEVKGGKPPSPRYRATLVSMGNYLVCAMGHDGYRHLSDLYTFNLSTQEWSQLSTSGPSPAPRDSHTACALSSTQMIIFGGSSGSSLNCMYRLKLANGEGVWSRVACSGMLPSARFCHSSVLIGKTMYTYGGYDGSNRLEDWIEFSFGENRVSHVPRSTIVSDMASLVNNPRCSDVSFRVEGRLIKAHRIICVRCDYFKAMFAREGGFRESQQDEIVILDVRYDIFYILLRYLYTDRQEVPLDLAMEVFVGADRFGIERLKSMCENKMLASVDSDNVSELFAAADLHHATGLHSRCLRYIVQHFDAVSKTSAFEEMGRSNIDLIFTILQHR